MMLSLQAVKQEDLQPKAKVQQEKDHNGLQMIMFQREIILMKILREF